MTPRRLSIPLALFALLTCGAIAFFIGFGKSFPPLMTLHVAADGRPDLFMDRVKFIVLGSFISLMVPTLIVTVVGVLPRVFGSALRRDAHDRKLWYGLWMACVAQAFLIAFFVSIYRANLR